jgi:ribose transport system substrate-binding protein
MTVGLVASACVTVTSESLTGSPAPEAEPSPVAIATDEAPSTEPPTPSEAPEEPSIGYIALDGSQAFVQTISTGVREAAADVGMKLVECDSGWTRPGVRACTAELVEAGVDGIVSMQPFDDLTEEVCATLGDVPTIGIVYDQGPCQVSLFEIDQTESGRLAGAAMGQFAADRWDCDVKAWVSLGSGAEDPIGGARMTGYRDGYREHCDLPKQKRQLNDAQHFITAQTQMESVLDDIKVKRIMVAGVSEDAILGAMSAASRSDRAKQLWYSGQLADPGIRQTIACDNHYIASVAQFPERFGSAVVPALLDAIDGAEVPSRLDAELQLVTADNVRDVFPDTPACGA